MLDTKTVICTGNANPKLAKQIARQLNVRILDMDVETFNDGEVRVELNDHVENHHVFIIQPTCNPTNDNLMELMVMVDAVRRSGAKSVVAVVPYYGYSRQDRRPNFVRTAITSRVVADMLVMVGINRIITVDIHSEQQKGFFPNHVPFTNIGASPELVAHIWRNHWNDDCIVVSPDIGGVARARSVAKQLDDADLAIIDKRRPNAGESSVMNIIGDVSGKTCIVIDDMIDTAGTLCNGAAALKANGANKVIAYATHGVFSGRAFLNIAESELERVVVTDTIPFENDMPPLGPQIEIISVSGLIAETIRRLRDHRSVSDMYVGH